MKTNQTILQALGVAAALGIFLTACEDSAPGEKAVDPVQAPEEKAEAEATEAGKTISVRGVLKHFPQDVKSTEAWLGHEFMVDETPIRTTEDVSAEVLKEMVGETVEIEGRWNAGKNWEPPKPTEEEFNLQRPTYPEGVSVVRGSGIEASSVRKVEY